MHRIRSIRSLAAGMALGLLFAVPAATAQEPAPQPGAVTVSIYRIAPGKHLEFLRWQAARDAAATEAGVGTTQWYVHMDGDDWDFVGISPETTPEQDERIDAIQTRQKLTTGFKAALEFRTMVASHTDTFARGPTTAAALVDAAK